MQQEYNEKELSLFSRLNGNFKAINQYRKLYNTLCIECKAKVLKNPKMDFKEYCGQCQNRVQYRIEKVKELIKG